MPFVAQPTEKCTACGRTVYATEKTVVEEKEAKKVYHKTCIRCKECNKVLSLGQYTAVEGIFYCKPHFKQLFATKGNYDEGFGKDKHTAKWEPVANSPGGTFVPETRDESATKEKNQTSEETMAKFKKYREEGDSNKCTYCDKTVYQAEKLLVENKNEKYLFHKACFKCNVCQISLDLRSYGSIGEKIYCKNHLKEALASQPATSTYMSSPTSFIPATEEEKRPVAEKNQTSEATAAKFRKYREEGEANKCISCAKTVYQAEKLLVENKNDKFLFHKACFKCCVCEMVLDLRSYGSVDDKIYCKNHLKEVSGVSRPASTNYVPSNKNFIPEVREEKSSEKGATPEHIAARFKGLGASGDKCKLCSKTVYATERVVVEELKGQSYFHKSCFRCSHCSIQLDVSSFGSSGGKIYCKVHLKEFGKPDQAKDGGVFISPLAKKDENYVGGARDENDPQRYEDEPQQRDEPSEYSEQESQRESEREREPEPQEEEPQREEEPQEQEVDERTRRQQERMREMEEEERRLAEEQEKRRARIQLASSDDTGEPSSREEERAKKREERERARAEEEKKYQEERERKEREREERKKQREEEEQREEQERERRKQEREERRRQAEEEAKREEEEAERRAEERRKRLEALNSEN